LEIQKKKKDSNNSPQVFVEEQVNANMDNFLLSIPVEERDPLIFDSKKTK
jgi:hypothetical protein